MRLTSITLVLLVATIFSGLAIADDAPKRSPELQVLDHFVGTWEHEVTVKPAGEEAVKVQTVDYRFWSRGGQILHFCNPTEDPEFHMSLTYDPASKTYPGVLLSGSTSATVTGTWDATRNTMVWAMKHADGNTFTGEHRFIGKDRAEASGAIKNAEGEVVIEFQYKQTRRSETAANLREVQRRTGLGG
jgi:hypothetical protein